MKRHEVTPCANETLRTTRSQRGPFVPLATSLVVAAILAGGVAATMAEETESQPAKPAPQPKAADTAGDEAEVPLQRVVLFSSGVGFFERNGQVEGDAELELQFNIDDINDLLKSMVVQDLDGGQISAVSYGSKDPITKTLKTFAVDLTENPTLADLLKQVRGERILLEAPDEITGVILGVETQTKQVDDDETVEVQILNLLTEDGLRAVPLDTVSRIELLNDKLDSELRKALALLASSHATDKKAVSLSFRGEGQRQVRIGYIQETPIWKTTYRLVLSDEESPLLQGWAIVENTTEEDWSDVDLTLVSGRPISFVMDLYQPLYVPRPEVQPKLYASLAPQTYGQDLAQADEEFRGLAKQAPRAPAMEKAEAAPQADRLAAARSRRSLAESKADKRSESAGWNLRQGAASVAEAAEVGEMFQYAIAAPVSLSRQKSAMLPIVNAEVKGKKVSIYNQRVHPKHPLAGLRLTNSTELHLMQGPITVFDGGAYAGDAQIEDLPPGSERLISYAMALDVEVAPQSKTHPEKLLSVRLVKGTMLVNQKYTRSHEYTVKNSGRKTKTVLIEYPLEPDWTLVQPEEPAEKTRDRYRFAVEAEPGVPTTLKVEEERTSMQHIALTNINDQTVRLYLSAPVVSDRVKQALEDLLKRKQQLAQVALERKQLEQQIETIGKEQARIRENMARLDRNSELYKRYVKKFSEQEDQIESLREQIQQLIEQEKTFRDALDEFLMGLDLE